MLFGACVTAQSFSGYVNVTGTLSAMTPSLFLPVCQGMAQHNVFFYWVAPQSTTVAFRTWAANGLDTVLSVFDDAACKHEVTCNDDW